MDFSKAVASVGKILVRAGGKNLWVLSRTVFRRANQAHFLVRLIFKGTGRGIAQRTVQPLAVVEDFNVLKDGLASLLPGGEALAVNQFHFEGAPERFHGGIVVTVAFAAHGRQGLAAGQGLAKISAGVLAAAIGVEDQFWRRLAMSLSHIPSRKDQLGVDGVVQGPPDDATAVEVHNASQIKPAFFGADVGDVAHPDLVGSARGWQLGQAIGGDGLIFRKPCGRLRKAMLVLFCLGPFLKLSKTF